MRDFSRSTVAALARKGIRVIGLYFVPGADGDFANGERAYRVDDNGTGRIWSFVQVREAAQ